MAFILNDSATISQQEYELKLHEIVEKRRIRCREANTTYHKTTGFGLTIRTFDTSKRIAGALTNKDDSSMLQQLKELQQKFIDRLNDHERHIAAGGVVSQEKEHRIRELRLWLKRALPLISSVEKSERKPNDEHSNSTVFNYTNQGCNLGARDAVPVARKDLSELDDNENDDDDDEEYDMEYEISDSDDDSDIEEMQSESELDE